MSFVLVLPILMIVFAISISWTNFLGAPWAPSSMRKVNKMLMMAEVKPGDHLYDLGCVDGRMIITAARKFGATAVGIEVDPLRYLWCKGLVALFGLQDRVNVIYGDFFKQDLSQADVVTCYLLQDTNMKLQEKLTRELQPNSRVVSNAFTFPVFCLADLDDKAKIYLYYIER